MRRIQLATILTLLETDFTVIEEKAAQLLERVGMSLDLPEALTRLAGIPQVRLTKGRVFFLSDDIQATLAGLRHPSRAPVNPRLQVGAGGGALTILDHRSGKLRPPTQTDLLLTLQVCERLGLSGDPPVIPAEVPMPLRELLLYRMVWEYTHHFNGRDITTTTSGEYIFEMAQVAGKRLSIPLYLINPLRINPENLRLILKFADRLPELRVSSMPMPGATAPFLAPGYLIQLLAEIVGGYRLLTLMFPGKPVHFGGKFVAFSPYTGSIACGSPEAVMQGQLETALLARYGCQPAHFFWSMAGSCDAQAAAERLAGVLLGALAGVRSFGVAGRLQGEAFSLEMLLVDLEIAAYVERLLQGQAWQEPDRGWLEEYEAAIAAGTFLSSTDTAANYRQETWRPSLFDALTLAQRQTGGGLSFKDQLGQRIESLAGPVPEPHLSNDVCAELDRIYHHAETYFRENPG